MLGGLIEAGHKEGSWSERCKQKRPKHVRPRGVENVRSCFTTACICIYMPTPKIRPYVGLVRQPPHGRFQGSLAESTRVNMERLAWRGKQQEPDGHTRRLPYNVRCPSMQYRTVRRSARDPASRSKQDSPALPALGLQSQGFNSLGKVMQNYCSAVYIHCKYLSVLGRTAPYYVT